MHELRPYQVEAVDAILEQLSSVRSTLLVMATGTGKTQVFVTVAGRVAGRVLILAHRDELIQQAADRVAGMLGEDVGIEKAERRAGNERVVVASVQTLRGKRLESVPKDAYDLVIIDEAHRTPARTYVNILHHFSFAKVLGVTATPDRADARAMGRVFDSVAYEYDILDAIDDGWLVDPVLIRVTLEGVDLSHVKISAGDFQAGDLENRLNTERTLDTISKSMFERAEGRQALVYTPGVTMAHRLAATLSAKRVGSARAVDGETPVEERRELLRDHCDGAYQYLVNCLVLTEGYDSPGVSCIAIARPTKSRALYAQILGRGLRTHPGKRDCLVIDYADVTRMDVVGPIDVLGGSMSDDVREEARRTIEEGGCVRNALEKASAAVAYRVEQARLRRDRQASRKKAPIDTTWRILGLPANILSAGDRYGLANATRKQMDAIERFGVDADGVCLDRVAAGCLIGELITRARARLATPAQLRLLHRYNVGSRNTTMQDARQMIDAIAANRWKLPDSLRSSASAALPSR